MELTYLQSTVHNHSTLCDGKSTLAEMAEAAFQKGVRVLGFSGHSHTPCDLEYCMSPEHTRQYRQEISRLQEEYRDRMDILCGLEWDQFSDDDPRSYEYWIGSVHYIHGPRTGVYYPVDGDRESLTACRDADFGGDSLAMAEAYFASVQWMAAQKPTILGHFDLIKKLNADQWLFREDAPRYREIAVSALEECARNVPVLEINTGAVSRGYRQDFYPADFLLRRWRELGGEAVITADCHSRENLLFAFDQAAQAARRAGYSRVAVMNGTGGFDFCPL